LKTGPQQPARSAEEPAATPPHWFRVEPGAHEPLADLAAAAGARIEESIHAPAAGPRRWVAYLFLGIAIVAGVIGTSALSVSHGFTRPVPATIVGAAYLVCFLAMTRALRVIPIGIVYAIWSGVGIALITLIGWRLFGQALEAGEIAGIVLILAGVVVIHLFSDARAH
jgi:small multidrug resistance pump